MYVLLLLIPFLFSPFSPPQEPEAQTPLTVLSFKWVRDHQPIEHAVSASVPPAPAMISANKNFEKQRRVNDPAGVRDPNADTLDGRASELERIVQQSREPEPVAGFSYLVRIQNSSPKITQTIFWEYQFADAANAANLTRRQFLCSAKLKPQQERDLRAFVLRGPTDTVDAKSTGKVTFKESVLINRVEYSDGTFWQRQGWSVDDFKLTAKARSETRNLPACRSL
jgi:hypothetical protein